MAELADAQASGACGSNIVWVQVPSSALEKEKREPFIREVSSFLLGQGPVSRMEFFVFRKMECWKQINHLLCEWLEML